MARRQFTTPPTLPTETQGRCLVIPASKEWLGIFNAVLLEACQTWNYEQVNETDLTAQETADRCYEIYIQWLSSVCTGGTMTCSEVLNCLASAGVGLVDYDYLQANPVTGDPQWSVNGTDWFDFQTVETTPVGDICLAATRAALVMGQFWQQTFVAVGETFWSVVTGINRFLQQVNQALLGLLYPQAAQVANALIWADFDFATYVVQDDLTAQQYADLTCLLYDNATLNADDTVSFDFSAVRDNLIAVLGVNPGTALTLLFDYVAASGLDQAGQVGITDTGSCLSCVGDAWCRYLDFEVSDQGFGTSGSTGVGLWVDGDGWTAQPYFYPPNSYGRALDISLELPGPASFAEIELMFDYAWGVNGLIWPRVQLYDADGVTQLAQYERTGTTTQNGIVWTIPIDPEIVAYFIRIEMEPCTTSAQDGLVVVHNMTLSGSGNNPFGGNNCV